MALSRLGPRAEGARFPTPARGSFCSVSAAAPAQGPSSLRQSAGWRLLQMLLVIALFNDPQQPDH